MVKYVIALLIALLIVGSTPRPRRGPAKRPAYIRDNKGRFKTKMAN